MANVTEADRDRTRRLIAELLNPLLETGSVDDILVFAVMRGDEGNLVIAQSAGERSDELAEAVRQWTVGETENTRTERYEIPPTVKQ